MAREARLLGREDLARKAEGLIEQARAERLDRGAAGWLQMCGLADVRPLDGADPRRTGGNLNPVIWRRSSAPTQPMPCAASRSDHG
jgi:hypothetical protein